MDRLLKLVVVMLLATASHGRPLDPAAAAAAGTRQQQQQKPVPNGVRVQKEWGFAGFTMPSFPSFSSLSSFNTKPTTTYAKSSLTGLPYVMSFSDQMAGGLPVVQWPPRFSQDAPTNSQPAQQQPPAASQPPAPVPQAAQAAPQPTAAPAPQPTPAPSTACSTDRSAGAVHACVNAMRTNPRAWTSAYKCDWGSWINGASSPARQPLVASTQLGNSAARIAEDMAGTRSVSHVGSDGSSMAQRIAASGFNTYPQAENVAGGQGSALEVAADWMCSEGHRTNILSCYLDTVGTATSYDVNGRAYYAQDFGCSVTNSCNSC